MPQMAPMNWVTLFMMFSIMLMITSSMNFFNYQPKITSYKTKKTVLKTNWKW